MKTYELFFKSKRSQLFILDTETNEIFRTSKIWNETLIEPCSLEDSGTDRRDLIEIEAENVDDARYKWVEIQIEKKNAQKAKRAEWQQQRQEEIARLLQMDVIPTTVENLSLILEHLNSHNWGSWELPKLSIGYSAHQYDCEGMQITTITLDRPINYLEQMERMFKSGQKRGHLENYNVI